MTARFKILLAALLATVAVAVVRVLTMPHPGPGSAAYASARRAAEQNDPGAAIPALRQAILLEPGNGDYHAELGEQYLRTRQYDRAAAALQMATMLSPDRPHVFCELAQALVEVRRREDAAAALETALRRAPKCPHALSVKAEQALRDDNLTESLALFRQVIALQPDFVLAYQKAGYILLESNRTDEALKVLQDGMARGPADPGIHYLLGEIYLRRPQDPQSGLLAEHHLRLALPGNPEADKVHAALGRLATRQRDWRQARAEYTQSLAGSPGNQEALFGMAQVARQEGRTAEADSLQRRLQAVQARGGSAAQRQATAGNAGSPGDLAAARGLIEQGLYRDAERALDGFVAAKPANREARALRADAYAGQGRAEQAKRERTIALRLPRDGGR